MWMFFAPAPRPEARYWPGRRMLAVIDAVLWPAAIAMVVLFVPVQTGAFGQVLLAICWVTAARRAWRAAVHNHQYRFTAAGVLGSTALLLVVAAALKVAV